MSTAGCRIVRRPSVHLSQLFARDGLGRGHRIRGRRVGRAAPRPQARVGEVVEALADEGDAEHEQHDRDAGEDRRPPDAAGDVARSTCSGRSPTRPPTVGSMPKPRKPRAARVEDRLGALSVKISGRVRVELRSTWRNMMRGVLAPTTFADSTNASALTRTASARMTRKYCGMNTTVIEIAAAKMPPTRLGLPPADRDRRDDREQQRRERVDRVGDDDQHAVEPAAEVAGDQAEQDADEDRQQHGDDDHEEARSARPRSRGTARRSRRPWCRAGARRSGGCCAPNERRPRRAAGRSRTARVSGAKIATAGRSR